MVRQLWLLPWEFFLGGIFGQTSVPVVKAAQPPSALGLSVVAAEDGVSACCEFEGYDTDEYTMLLYLNQMNGDRTISEKARKRVKPTDSGAGCECTDAKEVESGIYRATLAVSRKDGGDSPVTNFRDSVWYDVVRGDDGYTVSPHKEPSGEKYDMPQDKPVSGILKGDSVGAETSGCDHSPGRYLLDYRILQEADSDNDALLAGECVRCGVVLSYSYVPNSAYVAFQEEAIQAIQNAREEEVLITTRRWLSFHQGVFDAMAKRPEVAVTVRYRYNGKGYTVTIPAGAELEELTDENGFCGFRYLDQIFGGKEIIE